jgi:hypothetical protein
VSNEKEPEPSTKVVPVKFDEDEIKSKYLLPFVPSFLYGPEDFRVISVSKELFPNGLYRSVIVYQKKDIDRPGKFLTLTHYDDWVIPDWT